MSNIAEVFGPSSYMRAKDVMVGLECEVESVYRVSASLPEYGWNVTEDGSLRNGGKEFISAPMSVPEALVAFDKLYAGAVGFRSAHEMFSERTSIHVHVNCQNLQENQVRNIILMYALYEEFFFSLVNPDRRNNIHCVPLTETHFPVYYRSSLQTLYSKWHKYTALNAKPLSNLGTLEFRHMHGHNDKALLAVWLKTIENLFLTAQQPENFLNKNTLTGANLLSWFRSIFKDAPTVLVNEDFLSQLTVNQRLDIKLAVM